MAKGAYIGVGGKARKIKKGYIGVNMQIPVYATEDVSVTASNISDYFNVVNSPYYFAGSGNVFSSNNQGVAGSKAVTMLGTKVDMPNISFQYSWSTEANYDKFTLQVAGKNIEDAVSGVSTTKTFTGSLAKGQVIMFQYEKDNSQDKNDDLCKFWDMAITTQVQTGSETRPIARKIKKAYIGIGGKARPCWSGGELTYYGTITPLSKATYLLAATTIGNYALFAGGNDIGTVNAYDDSLTKENPSELSPYRCDLAATTVGNYALFGGGYTVENERTYVVEAYNTSLTNSRAPNLAAAVDQLAATAVGNYALFGGGCSNSSGKARSEMNAYDANLTSHAINGLSFAKYELKATTVGNYALFGGGYDNNNTDRATSIVNAYNTSLTRSTPTAFSEPKYDHAATAVGNYALFGSNDVVNAYDTSLTRTIPTPLSASRVNLAATTIGNYALFGGGVWSSAYSTAVDAYNESLTRTIPTELSIQRGELAAATVGNYALFGGGYTGTSPSTTDAVDAYTIA